MNQRINSPHIQTTVSPVENTQHNKSNPFRNRTIFSDNTAEYIFAALVELQGGGMPCELILTTDIIREILELSAAESQARAIVETRSTQESDLSINLLPLLMGDVYHWKEILARLLINHPNGKVPFQNAFVKEILDVHRQLLNQELSHRHGYDESAEAEEAKRFFRTAQYFCSRGEHALAQGFFSVCTLGDRSNKLYGLAALNCQLHHIKNVEGVVKSIEFRSNVAKQSEAFLEAIVRAITKSDNPTPSCLEITDLCYRLIMAKADYLSGEEKLAATEFVDIVAEVQYTLDAKWFAEIGVIVSRCAIVERNETLCWLEIEVS